MPFLDVQSALEMVTGFHNEIILLVNALYISMLYAKQFSLGNAAHSCCAQKFVMSVLLLGRTSVCGNKLA